MTSPTHTAVSRVRAIECHGQNVWDVMFYSSGARYWVAHRAVLDILALSLTKGLEVTVEIASTSSEIRSAHAAAGTPA
ncbi:hypothetical protein [Actinomycetospora sp. NBRC 106375]|uniref:hypothetical protein n=1 Tax=Actinomycetospora sp. NBRC 106375 TaxID=3032207 RepID=UPI00255459AD|nr:hypothetical protein [Actinomycetospora sp. NBRC 106375]